MSRRPVQTTLLVALLELAALGAGMAEDFEHTDAEMERFLLKAKVVRVHRVMTATTYPMALELEHKKQSHRAAFKYGHSERSFDSATGSDGVQRVVLDSYLHEVAAYRLDRALGLRMVPVAVLREVNAPGAVIEWVSGTVTEAEAAGRDDQPAAAEWLAGQQAVMRFFDALIDNASRDPSDQLINIADRRLHLIDHSCAFGESVGLPEGYEAEFSDLPADVLERLAALDERAMRDLLGDLLGDGQIVALMARRGAILQGAATSPPPSPQRSSGLASC